jgi:hypothetical protein
VVALISILTSVTLQALPVTFQFSTTVDATPLGGGPATPLIATYTFDSDLPNGSGPTGPVDSTCGSYGTLFMQIQLGNEIVTASGGGISVFNDAGTTFVEDSYDVRPDDGIFSGQLLGHDITFFRFLIVDLDRTMFSSTALPLMPGFATSGDYQQTEIQFADGSYLGVEEFFDTPSDQRVPFTLTIVPEPSTVALLAIGGLMSFGWPTGRRDVSRGT